MSVLNDWFFENGTLHYYVGIVNALGYISKTYTEGPYKEGDIVETNEGIFQLGFPH